MPQPAVPVTQPPSMAAVASEGRRPRPTDVNPDLLQSVTPPHRAATPTRRRQLPADADQGVAISTGRRQHHGCNLSNVTDQVETPVRLEPSRVVKVGDTKSPPRAPVAAEGDPVGLA